MPKFKNREEYEEWKAKKLQESKEKLTAGPQRPDYGDCFLFNRAGRIIS